MFSAKLEAGNILFASLLSVFLVHVSIMIIVFSNNLIILLTVSEIKSPGQVAQLTPVSCFKAGLLSVTYIDV